MVGDKEIEKVYAMSDVYEAAVHLEQGCCNLIQQLSSSLDLHTRYEVELSARFGASIFQCLTGDVHPKPASP